MTLKPCLPLSLGLLALQAALPATAADGWTANLRFRHEAVDDHALARSAAADTLRLRLGWSRALAHGFSTGFEGEGVAELSDRFNSGANGKTAYPAVPDARALEINQAWLRWRGERGGGTLGRQRLGFDNHRFVGNVGWRQNEQTFDGLAADATLREGLVLRYAWLDRVHRVFGDQARDPLARERRLDTHLVNLGWQFGGGSLTGYGYWHEDRDVAAASTRTLGLRWNSQRTFGKAGFGWTLEVANQQDHAGNPSTTDADYFLVEPSLVAGGLTWKLGWEQLGGNGATAFQTPLATLHAFNGWADKFLVTPANGLDDRYASVSGKFGAGRLADTLAWTVAWHDYRSDRGSIDYGHEWDASLSIPLTARLTGLAKFADYRSHGFARDTRKLWLQVEWAWP
ncbi:alginate export family protein [Arenimonas sp.]|uniref:alginate export family protein n=1 Tax=Arenimonas sp. TaxID=1872635 RepID=UPI0025BA5317|nr:alginate export family protein [Arenimonas sp.]